MKKSRLKAFIFIFTITGLFVSAYYALSDNSIFQPEPAGEMQVEDEQGNQLKRIQWIENMHRVSPGTDWRRIEERTRWNKYYVIESKKNQRLSSSVLDTIANGTITGTWNEKGSANQSGRIHVAEFDSSTNRIYCGSAGGIVWRGNMDGTNWTPLNDRIKFENILMVHVVPHGVGQRILVACSGNPYFTFSDDSGTTWQQSSGLNYIASWGRGVRSVQTGDSLNTIYYLAEDWDSINWSSQTTVYKSTNSGSDFYPVQAFTSGIYGSVDNIDIWAARNGNDTVYLISQNGSNASLFKLDPAATNFQLFSAFTFNSGDKILLTGINSNPLTFYSYSDKAIYRSTNGGTTWAYRSTVTEDYFSRSSFSCSQTNPNSVFTGGVQAYHSYDGGNNFNMVNGWGAYYGNPAIYLHADIPCIIPFYDNGEKYFIGTDGGLYISTDSLQQVNNISLNGLNVSQYYSTYTNRTNSNYIFAGSQDQGYQRCRNDSGTVLGFQQKISGDYAHIVSSNGGNSIWLVYPSFIAYIANAPNTTGQFSATWDFNGATNFWMPPLMADPFGVNHICYMAGKSIAGSGSHIIKLNFTGSIINATEMSFDFFSASSGGYLSAVSASATNPNDWYALTENGKFFYSNDAGQTWNLSLFSNAPSPHYFYGSAIYVSKFHPGTVIIGGSGYSNPPVYMSTDSGQTFTDISSGLPSTLVFELIADEYEDYLFAATEAGPYVYVYAQNQWFDMSEGNSPNQVYWGVDYIPLTHTVRFATYGRGIWDFNISSVVAGQKEITAKNDFSIFPNPGSGIFHINSSLTGSKINVYDYSGKLIYNNSAVNYIDLTTHPKGVYFVEVVTASGVKSVKKVVVN